MKTRQDSLKSPIRRFVIFGKGQWGQALGESLSFLGHKVSYIRRGDPIELSGADYVILATPFKELDQLLRRLAQLKTKSILINASKGIHHKTLQTFTPLAAAYGFKKTATLSGPTFAKELRKRKPTACVIASKSKKLAQKISQDFSTPFFRIYQHTDPIGVEVCGALKNVLAIASGISDASLLGSNSRAALLTRGLSEMTIAVQTFGGKASTVFGLAGMGDLWLTATGPLSRNRQFGEQLGKGLTPDQALKKVGQIVEGFYTVQQVEKIRKQKKLELPICHEVYLIACRGKSVQASLKSLMSRALKIEESSQWTLLQKGSSRH